MEELKNFELNNKILEKFDDVMGYHLDQVEELTIKEVFTNPKLYNIISLCINLKSLVIEGDLRVDVNKIMFNVCKPELLETLILNSVKLPTTKAFEKFTNIQTISLTNITFSNVSAFFDKIVNKEKIEALNLSNIDFGKKSINLCGQFPNLKYLNIDGLSNCKFDDFSFLGDSKKIERFDFFGNEIGFDVLKDIIKKKYTKNVDVKLKTSSSSHIDNRFEINSDGEISLTINTSDLDEATSYLPLSKIQNLFLIIEDETPVSQYMKKIRRVKGKVRISLKEMYYLTVDTAHDIEDKLGLENIGILDYDNSKVINYSIEDYINIREKFDVLIENTTAHFNEVEMFEELCRQIKDTVEYEENDDCTIKTFFLENKSNYNLYASVLKSVLRTLKIDNRVISGFSYNDKENIRIWNQVKLDGDWYNVDLGGQMKFNSNKKFWQFGAKEILQNDEVFMKNHTPQSGKLEICDTKVQDKRKELKNSVKKISPLKKFVNKIKSIFKFNKNKALPEKTEDTNSEE